MKTIEDTPACPQFEGTLLLMDGLLAGESFAIAMEHVRRCDVCGPLVSSWEPISDRLSDTLEEEAELAKPGLADLSHRVLTSVAKKRPPRAAWLRPAWSIPAFAAGTAALALVVFVHPTVPPVTPGHVASIRQPAPAPVHSTPPAEAPAVVAVAQPVAPADVPSASNDCHMHTLSFDRADGMVYRTEKDGMTVIWVNEHDGA